jgi:hypothetical protein
VTSVDGDHLRDLRGPVHVRLLDRHDSASEPAARLATLGQVRQLSAQLVVVNIHGPTVDMQPDLVADSAEDDLAALSWATRIVTIRCRSIPTHSLPSYARP